VGLTLVELLVAIAVTTMVVTALGSLTRAVQLSSEYSDGRSSALQHARVTLSRIERMVNEAHASDQFPGAVVFADSRGGWRLPETLVVWHPAGAPAFPTLLPRFSELVIFCPQPSDPSKLLEITAPTDNRQVPALSSTSWATELLALKTGSASKKVMLTELVRVGKIADESRGAVRFEAERRPSDAEWASYTAGTTTWENVAWVQGVRGAQTGLAQTWVRIELQLIPARPGGTTADSPITFFGSAAAYYERYRTP